MRDEEGREREREGDTRLSARNAEIANRRVVHPVVLIV